MAHGAEGMAHMLAAVNRHTSRSGGVYPRPYWVPANRNRSDAIALFRGVDFGLQPL